MLSFWYSLYEVRNTISFSVVLNTLERLYSVPIEAAMRVDGTKRSKGAQLELGFVWLESETRGFPIERFYTQRALCVI